MPESAQSASQKSAGSFASFLASFTSNLQSDKWDEGLADDVTTLTYEQALRATPQAGIPEMRTGLSTDKRDYADAACGASLHKAQSRGAEKKNASITIRVTAEEQAQLHERAAAAGLSVSAYLRSCIFEAESLRSQVKEALAQMQSTRSDARPSTAKLDSWRKRFFPAWSLPKSKSQQLKLEP